MKRASFLAIVMILGTALGFGNDYIVKIESMKNRGDIQGLQAEYDRLSSLKNRDALTECALGETTAFLLVCREERDGQKPENNTYALESVGYLRAGLALDRLEDADIADAAYTLSLMYNRLIRDAASWMKYNAEKEKYIRVCLEKNPAHVGAQLVSALSLMNLPKSAGGDPDKGRSELDALRTEHPDHLGILTETGALLLQENKYDAAEKVYSRIFALYPDYPPARKILEELSVMKMALPIQDIRITGMLKTSKARILRKVASAIGTKYSMQTKMDIESRIMEIKSITGCQIEAVPNVADTVSLNISISENNMYMLGALGSLSLSRDYEGDLNPGGFPAMIYMDQNIFGTADSLNIIFAGVYVNLDYFKAGVIDDKYPDIKFHWDSMFLDSPSVPIEDGKPLKDLAVKSPKHQVSISIGKDFPVGLSAFVGARLKAENWTILRSLFAVSIG